MQTITKMQDCGDEYFYLDEQAVKDMQKSTANYSQIKDITMGACIVLIVELLWMTCGNLNLDEFKFEEAPYQGKIDLKENEDKSQVVELAQVD